MELYYKVNNLRDYLLANKHKKIGFVPTMGALHNGHLSLIDIALKENDIVICSVFVNPAQFNNADDLKVYPRNLELDTKMLNEAGCNILFAPSIEEIYPTPDSSINVVNDFGVLTKVMEAAYRPGHFDGVILVVKRLFEIVEPTNAYFGEKDYQQLAVIRRLVKNLDLKINIIGCPIIREDDGLAMSSRNMNLSNEERLSASFIPKVLLEAKQMFSHKSVSEVKDWVQNEFRNKSELKLEYFELANAETLEVATDASDKKNIRGFIVAYSGKTRLIDNIQFSI